MARPFHGHTTLQCTAQRRGTPVFCGGLSAERRGAVPVLPRSGDRRAGRRSADGSYCNLLCNSMLWVLATRRERAPPLAERGRPWLRRPPGTAGATSTHRARKCRVTPRVIRLWRNCVWKIPALRHAKLEAPTRRPASVDDRPAVAGGAKHLRARAPVGEQCEQVENADVTVVVEVGGMAGVGSPCGQQRKQIEYAHVAADGNRPAEPVKRQAVRGGELDQLVETIGRDRALRPAGAAWQQGSSQPGSGQHEGSADRWWVAGDRCDGVILDMKTSCKSSIPRRAGALQGKDEMLGAAGPKPLRTHLLVGSVGQTKEDCDHSRSRLNRDRWNRDGFMGSTRRDA